MIRCDTSSFPPPTHPRFLTEYSHIERIGGGDFGSVFRAVYDMDNEVYAVKQMRQPPQSHAQLQRHLQEAYALSSINSSHVLRYYDSWVEGSDVSIRTELLAPLRSVTTLLIGDQDVWDFILQMGIALRDIHARGLAHLDVKPENILVGSSGGARRYKLADLGLARSFNMHPDNVYNGLNDDEGDRRYLCPYLLRVGDPRLLAAADIYSLGVTILEMIGGSQEAIVSRNIARALITAAPLPSVHHIITAMTADDPHLRPDAFNVVRWAQSHIGIPAYGGDEIDKLRLQLHHLQRKVDKEKEVTQHLTASLHSQLSRQ